MRVIFVPVADQPECIKALNTGFALAQKLGANLCGCHIRPHRESVVSLTTGLALTDNFGAGWGTLDKPEVYEKGRVAAQTLFNKISAHHNYPIIKKPGATPGALWKEKVGAPDKVLSIMGPVSDLVIVSRPATKGGNLARIFMYAALLNSSRPVLVLPQSGKSPVGQRISIAWNQSAEAAQAVAAAMPLLLLADQVNIITCGPELGAGPKSGQLATYLRFWGVKAKRVSTSDSNVEKSILKAYRDTDSDLLVMGAYSRSRLRQRIFGGVTEFMLNRANIPTFMLHV